MPPTTQEVLEALVDLQTAAMPPGWRAILASAQTEIERLRSVLTAIRYEEYPEGLSAEILAAAALDGDRETWADTDGEIPRPEPCPYCSAGKRTGLPGNACENCMNTGLAHPADYR